MIHLAPFCSSNYQKLISWVDSAELLMQFAGPAFTYPLTPLQLEESLSDKRRIAFNVIDNNTAATIGYAEIYVTPQTACLGRIIIGDKQLRGKGLGLQLVNALLDYAFLKLHHSTADLNVFDWNIGAIKCYEKAGFVMNPNKKLERKINGKTWIAVNMKLDKKSWLQLKKLS